MLNGKHIKTLEDDSHDNGVIFMFNEWILPGRPRLSHTRQHVSTTGVQYIDGLDTDLDLLGLDRVGRYDSTRGRGGMKGATLGKCP